MASLSASETSFHDFELTAGLFGVVGAGLVIATYFMLPRFRQHPSGIILLVSISDLFLGLKFLMRGSAWLALPEATDLTSFHLFKDNCTSSIIWSAVFETASITWNTIWCVHMAIQIYYPTFDTRRLMKFYHVYAAAIVIMLTVIQLTLSDRGLVSSAHGYEYCSLMPRDISHNNAFLADYAVAMIQLAVSIIAVVMTMITFGCGYNSETSAVAKRHYLFATVFIILWTMEKSFILGDVSDTFHTIVAVLWQAQGFFVALVRLSEPGLLLAFLAKIGINCKKRGDVMSHPLLPNTNTSAGEREALLENTIPGARAWSPRNVEEEVGMPSRIRQDGAEHIDIGLGARQDPSDEDDNDIFSDHHGHQPWGVSDVVRNELLVSKQMGMTASSRSSTPKRKKLADSRRDFSQYYSRKGGDL